MAEERTQAASARGLAGGVEFAAGGGFVEEVTGLVLCGFGVGEHGD